NNADLSALNIQGVIGGISDENLNNIIKHGSKFKTEEERIDLLKALAELLNIDYFALNSERLLNLIKFEEIDQLLNKGKGMTFVLWSIHLHLIC
ncbi:MAG: hypothetical protein HOI58_07915, partial [Kordiimonadaceae bacterium]|nr:hypothetical protein [Kordiimonadaceae bacterium]